MHEATPYLSTPQEALACTLEQSRKQKIQEANELVRRASDLALEARNLQLLIISIRKESA